MMEVGREGTFRARRSQIGADSGHGLLEQGLGIGGGFDQDGAAGFHVGDAGVGNGEKFILGVQVFGVAEGGFAQEVGFRRGVPSGDLTVVDRLVVVWEAGL